MDSKRFDAIVREALGHLSRRSAVRRGLAIVATAPLAALFASLDEGGASRRRRRRARRRRRRRRRGQRAAACLNPAHDLQAAINAAEPGSTLTLCPGTWLLTRTIDMTKELTLAGAGIGQTILDGGGRVRVIEVGFAPARVTLQGLTITRGNATQGQDRNGGGIYNDGALKLVACSVSNCTAIDNGGGIFNAAGQMELIDSHVTGNTATLGGGIYNTFSTVLRNCRVEANSATTGGGIYTGATFCCLPTSLTLTSGSRVTNNVASAEGGGIYVLNGSLNLQESDVTGNQPSNCAWISGPGSCTP